MGKGEKYSCAFCLETLSAGDAFVSEMDELEWLEQYELDSPEIDVEFPKQEYGPLRICRNCRDSIHANEDDLETVENDIHDDGRMAIRIGIVGVVVFLILAVVMISLFDK